MHAHPEAAILDSVALVEVPAATTIYPVESRESFAPLRQGPLHSIQATLFLVPKLCLGA